MLAFAVYMLLRDVFAPCIFYLTHYTWKPATAEIIRAKLVLAKVRQCSMVYRYQVRGILYQGKATTYSSPSCSTINQSSLTVWYNSAQPNKSTAKYPHNFEDLILQVGQSAVFSAGLVSVGATIVSILVTPLSRVVSLASVLLHTLLSVAVVLPTSAYALVFVCILFIYILLSQFAICLDPTYLRLRAAGYCR